MYVILGPQDMNGNRGLVGSTESLVDAWETCESLRESFPHKDYIVRDNFNVIVIDTARDMRKPNEWCQRCGAGNDALGFAQLALCPTNA